MAFMDMTRLWPGRIKRRNVDPAREYGATEPDQASEKARYGVLRTGKTKHVRYLNHA
jgi:hypothetical protein